MPNLFFFGEERFLLDEQVKKLKDSISMPELNLHILEGLDLEKVISAAQQVPFCSDSSLVIVKDNFKGVPEDLIDYLKGVSETTVLLFICSGTPDKRTKFYKTISKIGKVQEFKKLNEKQIDNFIVDYCNKVGAKISQEAINLLVVRTGYLQKEKEDVNLYSIINYLDKLTNYSKNVTVADVEKLVDTSPEENVFKLMDLISSNMAEAFKYTRGLMESGNHPLALIPLILRHFRIIYKLKIVDDASLLELHPFVLRNMKGQEKKYTEKGLLSIIEKCLEVQKAIKTGRMTAEMALDNLLVFVSTIN